MIKVKFDSKEMGKAYWDGIQKALGKDVPEGLKDVARLGATDAATKTFPTGTSNTTKNSLEKAIYKDINRAYKIGGNKVETDTGSYLLMNRNTKGRIPSSITPKYITKANYEALKEKFVKQGGLAKSGYLEGAKDISSKVRIPKWLKKDQKLGHATVRPLEITVINEVKYADSLLTDSQKEKILAYAYIRLKKYAERILEKKMK